MKSQSVSKSKKLLAALIAFVLVLTAFFSAYYISAELDHDCSGDGCPVCAVIQLCENFLRQAGSGNVQPGFEIFRAFDILFAAAFLSLFLVKKTPVKEKIRLNN